MRNGSRSLLLLCSLALLPGLSATQEEEYRVTGIMGSDTGKAYAVIETADGRQQLLSEGGAIGPGYVKSISSTARIVVLALPDGEVSLRLAGSGRPDEYQEEFSIADFHEETVQQSLDPVVVSKLLALSGDAEKLSEEQIALQLNQLLGLSAQARIAAYNNQGVNSARAVLQQLGAKISGLQQGGADFLGSIAVTDQQGQRRVYLSAQPSAN